MSEKEHMHDAKHGKVRVHIDRRQHESPNPTTGSALYRLGDIPHGFELFREVEGNQEDKAIPNDGNEIHLREDEHFYSAVPEFKIIVNGEQKVVHKDVLTFQEVVALAFNPLPQGANILIKVKYEHGPHVNHEGSLQPGGEVRIKSGMRFHVTATNQS
ncbi:multiubiquitin domain-containing protein [Nostoc sp. KVJ3]|uniref:multiubiquitin domain-containing protein n=1 Tax=Nostoc sp. KVJ3 TaxID=457945 RepID=UPI0022383B51|nr:multiubiquitin domain-containing protein [Nostoc sp. KVJ3]